MQNENNVKILKLNEDQLHLFILMCQYFFVQLTSNDIISVHVNNKNLTQKEAYDLFNSIVKQINITFKEA